MKLGIIGPLDSVRKIEEVLGEIDSDIEIQLYIREKVIDCVEVIEECEQECDAIMFTGCAVYEYIRSKYDIKKPHAFVTRGGTSIAKAFWDIKKINIELDKFSIDVVGNDVLNDILKEFNIDPNNAYCLPFSLKIDEIDYFNWHISLFESKKTNVMITGFGSVYNELKKRGYPVFRLEATIPLIKVCYEKIESEYALSKAQYSQISVEILRLVDNTESIDSYYSNMIKKSDMDKFIIDYVRSIQGSLFLSGRNEYVVFAHKGAVDNESNYCKLLKLQKDIKSIGYSLSVGIGTGITAYQADSNARKALGRSAESKEYNIFLVDESQNIKGPLGSLNEINYSLASSDGNIIKISEKTGLSCESIAKIMAISETRKSKVYDPKELAVYLDISERSARRILQKIITADLGRIYAKETGSSGGRPKSLIEILF